MDEEKLTYFKGVPALKIMDLIRARLNVQVINSIEEIKARIIMLEQFTRIMLAIRQDGVMVFNRISSLIEKELSILPKFTEMLVFSETELVGVLQNGIKNLYVRDCDLEEIHEENWFGEKVISICRPRFDSRQPQGVDAWKIAEIFVSDRDKFLRGIFSLENTDFATARKNVEVLPKIWLEKMMEVWVDEFVRAEQVFPKKLLEFVRDLGVTEEIKNLDEKIMNQKISQCCEFYWKSLADLAKIDQKQAKSESAFLNDFVDFCDDFCTDDEILSKLYLIQQIFDFLSEFRMEISDENVKIGSSIGENFEKSCWTRIRGDDHEKLLNYFRGVVYRSRMIYPIILNPNY